jgi:hypothetical protein
MARNWESLVKEFRQVAAEANGFRVEIDYWEDSLLGGFYDPARPGDVPGLHLSVYAGGEVWGECPLNLDVGTPWRTLFYWAEKILKALERDDYLTAAAVCPFARTNRPKNSELEEANAGA